MIEALQNLPAPASHAIAAIAGAIFGGWITHRFAIHLDRRRTLTATAQHIREALLYSRSHLFHDRFTEADIDLFLRLLPWWKRTRFSVALRQYQDAKKKSLRSDGAGGAYFDDLKEIQSRLDELIRLTDLL